MLRIVLLAGILFLFSCDPLDTDDNPIDNRPAGPYGTLLADFPITHIWIPPDRIIRTELNIALNAYDMYRGHYIQSANVCNSQQQYLFNLAPGSYYLEAAIACLCGGDSCSAGGFPGNQWGRKYTSYKFTIEEDKTTLITIRFLK